MKSASDSPLPEKPGYLIAVVTPIAHGQIAHAAGDVSRRAGLIRQFRHAPVEAFPERRQRASSESLAQEWKIAGGDVNTGNLAALLNRGGEAGIEGSRIFAGHGRQFGSLYVSAFDKMARHADDGRGIQAAAQLGKSSLAVA